MIRIILSLFKEFFLLLSFVWQGIYHPKSFKIWYLYTLLVLVVRFFFTKDSLSRTYYLFNAKVQSVMEIIQVGSKVVDVYASLISFNLILVKFGLFFQVLIHFFLMLIRHFILISLVFILSFHLCQLFLITLSILIFSD